MPDPLWDVLGWLVAGWGRVSVCVMCVVITRWALVKVYGIVNSPAQIVATTDINQEYNFERTRAAGRAPPRRASRVTADTSRPPDTSAR